MTIVRSQWSNLSPNSFQDFSLDSLTFVAAALRASEYCKRCSSDDLCASQALQWRTHRGGWGSGVNPPPLKILKEMKTSLLGTNRLFHTEIAEIALMFFYAIQLGYKMSKNFHCDAIIGLPVVTFCRKKETFLF